MIEVPAAAGAALEGGEEDLDRGNFNYIQYRREHFRKEMLRLKQGVDQTPWFQSGFSRTCRAGILVVRS